MSATLKISGTSRLADLVWPYQIVLDGNPVGKVGNGGHAQFDIAPGTHTVQIRSLHILLRHFGFASPTVTFTSGDGEAAEYVCEAPRFVRAAFWWIACLIGDRSRWVGLQRVDSPARPAT